MSMSVARILASKGKAVHTIAPHRTLLEAARSLGEKRIGALVVTGADGQVLGILSERDIARALVAGAGALEDAVSKHMTEDVVMCRPSTSLHELMEQMTLGRFRHVPVLDGGGQLAGLVSIGDAVKLRLAEMEADSRAMRDYIATA